MSAAGNEELAALAAVLDARRTFIRGETTEGAVTATCITVLTSLRADTATVKKRPSIFDGRYLVEIEEVGAVAGWAAPAHRGRRGHRVVRMGGSSGSVERVNGCRIVNLAGNYARGGNGRVYSLAIYNKDGGGKPFYPAKAESIWCIAASVDDVRKFAQTRIKRRIEQYRGISKRALGAAMHAFHVGGRVESGPLQRLADSVVDVRKELEGFDSGRVRCSVADNLPHAEQALKSGTVNTALRKAVNSTVAKINRWGERQSALWERIESPFADVIPNASRSGSARGVSGLYMSGRDTLVHFRV